MTCDWGNDGCHNEGFLCEPSRPLDSKKAEQRYLCAEHLAKMDGCGWLYRFISSDERDERFQADMAARRAADPEWDR